MKGVTRLANSMLLSVTLDLFSDEQFSIILAFFECVIFFFSVLMFLLIRVCSVSAISGSLFSNGSQMACEHSKFLEKSVLLRRTNCPVFSGIAKRLR